MHLRCLATLQLYEARMTSNISFDALPIAGAQMRPGTILSSRSIIDDPGAPSIFKLCMIMSAMDEPSPRMPLSLHGCLQIWASQLSLDGLVTLPGTEARPHRKPVHKAVQICTRKRRPWIGRSSPHMHDCSCWPQNWCPDLYAQCPLYCTVARYMRCWPTGPR